MIKLFSKQQALIAMNAFKYDVISNKLRYSLSKKQFIKMLDIIESKFVDENISAFISKIRKLESNLDKLKDNKSISDDLKTLKLLVK